MDGSATPAGEKCAAHLHATAARLTLSLKGMQELDLFAEQEDEWQEAMPRLVEAWQQSVNWYATPEENAAWQQFDQGCEAFLSPYLEADENGETDLGVWPSGIPAAPDEHEGEGALWEIARREVASGPEQDIRRRIASAVLFRLFLARLARRFARVDEVKA